MKKLLFLLLAVVMLLLSSCAPASISGDHYALDTIISITLYNTQDSSILQQCWDRIDELESLLSRTRPGSDVYRINHAGGEPVTVANETAELISMALEIAEKSGGALDISIGPVIELWDFKASSPTLPDQELLSQAAAKVDYTKIHVSGNKVTLPAGMSLDLGAIAKGYIADQLIGILDQSACDCAILNLGGNVLTYGTKKDKNPWAIGIRDPRGSANDALLSLSFSGSRAVVTSGIYERSFELNNTLYHHLLDPSTGMPAKNDLLSVTIIASNSALADGLSTACFVLGDEKALPLLESYPQTEGLFLFADGTEKMTEGFASLVTSR